MTATAEDRSLLRNSWDAALTVSPGNLDLEVPASKVSGVLPKALRGGRFLSNGPGWTRIGGRTAHPFDGHGYVRAFEFTESGGVKLRARFVGTSVYREEAKAGHLTRRGLGTNRDGGLLGNLGIGKPRNVANTTVIRWGDRLIAGWEGGVPHALDAESLETIGPETFGGAIARQVTLAHMHPDAALGRLILCSPDGFRKPKVTFRELGSGGGTVSERTAQFQHPLVIHDFAFTENWYVLAGNPARIRPDGLVRMLAGMGTLIGAVEWDLEQEPALYLIPRNSGGPVRRIRLPGPSYVVHFGNAFERDGTVVVDACVFSYFEFGQEFGFQGPHKPFDPFHPLSRRPQLLHRITADPGRGTSSWHRLADFGADFPRVDSRKEGRDVPAVFAAARADPALADPFDSIFRVDLRDLDRPPDLWTAPPGSFAGEPVFAPDPDREEHGYVIAVISDGAARESTLAVFDSKSLSKGPVSSLKLPLLPIAFHGDWDARRA